ncbi:saccharopine dehydrogenase NADP-binding domain-containing protein [Haloferax larsenii]|uniref:Saccharopine dehydrogenase NADP-binding domain-containing protein n=1 Tax=Haloferax larsenii TaxID=302484 RepID=A0ABY5RC63_HALLR|nr:saccharopine dehydrogenase NADP-binding domain-containing protein [Haloferax larsenii]UVE49932.1 saccharopine dehydrogenase NADP-binding domain-containing protein [Haloferax larsenii]
MRSDRILVYGAYGYTGRLVTEQAVADGLDPIVAGRSAGKVESLATNHGLDHRVFALDDHRAVADALADAEVVLNCAGPFVRTSEPLVDASIQTGTHYLDITGEIEVFESIAARNTEAEAAGVTLMPGVGFDVVPTDSLAAHLAERLPDATHLELGFQGLDELSPGTAHTTIESLGESGTVRRDGDLVDVPVAHDARTIDFGDGPTTAATIQWGDVSTAYHTTGIPNVTVYAAQPEATIRFMRLSNRLGWLLGSTPVQSVLHSLVDWFVDGPSETARREESMYVWGRATNGEESVVSRLVTPESYLFTSHSAPYLAARVRDGDAPAGFQTPASAFGPDVALDVGGVERTDE